VWGATPTTIYIDATTRNTAADSLVLWWALVGAIIPAKNYVIPQTGARVTLTRTFVYFLCSCLAVVIFFFVFDNQDVTMIMALWSLETTWFYSCTRGRTINFRMYSLDCDPGKFYLLFLKGAQLPYVVH
jgi:hypothetical protein